MYLIVSATVVALKIIYFTILYIFQENFYQAQNNIFIKKKASIIHELENDF